ncbi:MULTISPECIES: hypothetical protein [unclassified Bradyrhizobium]|uniref:hypothetical protein n=1 Tax=unclassified Bradyrhizobium TaxID=2631580 RepID=UPI0029164F42|nr:MULTISPECIES: hypothetical protein [unclassified Bradyrhizobium]
MTTDTEKREADILRTLRSRYEQRGFTFIAHPARDLVPPFLQGYTPDALAISERESVVIEVKAARSPASQKSLSRIAQLVARQPNWKFEVYYGGDFPRTAYRRPTKGEVSLLVDEVRQLASAGFVRAAVVMGWAALEAIARGLRIESEEFSLEPMIPSAIVEWLVSQGHVDSGTGRALRQMIRVRNAIVHGDQSIEMGTYELSALINTLGVLAEAYR